MNDTLLNIVVYIANDIYTTLGAGYNEVIYHRAFEVGLRLNTIKYESEVVTPVLYKGHNVGHGRVDLKLDDFIIELKAINTLNNDCIIQTKNYMKHYNITSGMVVNFGQSKYGLQIILINNDVLFDYINGSFVQRIDIR
jgi:GxxExxY protein